MRTADDLAHRAAKISVEHLNFYYGPKQALSDVTLSIPQHCVTALIGPFVAPLRVVGGIVLVGIGIYGLLTAWRSRPVRLLDSRPSLTLPRRSRLATRTSSSNGCGGSRSSSTVSPGSSRTTSLGTL